MGLQPAFRRTVFAVILIVTLCFGWWPFSFSGANDVVYDVSSQSVRFNKRHEEGRHSSRGVAYSDRVLDTKGWPGITVVVELKGRWNGAGLGVFLEFFETRLEGVPEVTFAQWRDHLALRSRRERSEVARGYSEIGYQGLFSGNRFVELVVCSENRRTHVYVDGKLAEARSDFPLVGPDNAFAGRLAIGNSSDGKSAFKGEIRRMAVYSDFYKPGTVKLNRTSPVWSFDASDATLSEKGLPQVEGLAISESFEAARRSFLNPIKAPKWERPGFTSDIVKNSLGFIPIGICFAAAARRRFRGLFVELLTVAIASFCVSLAIELGQGFMVQRDSSQLDLALNTLSGMLGVFVPRRWVMFL